MLFLFIKNIYRLFWPSQIRLGNQNVAHRQHTKSSQFFRCIKHDRRKSWRHFWIQTNLDTSLNFVFAFNQQIKQFLGINHSLSEIGHKANQGRVPLVDNLGKGRRSWGHKDLTNSVVEPLHGLIFHSQKALGRSLFGNLKIIKWNYIWVNVLNRKHSNRCSKIKIFIMFFLQTFKICKKQYSKESSPRSLERLLLRLKNSFKPLSTMWWNSLACLNLFRINNMIWIFTIHVILKHV